ncbi:MAG: hypothetical protein HYZ14_10790 [Bacteroidetes bacterium]|nr:hypothetical protein [Bacteroidota bacterium]
MTDQKFYFYQKWLTYANWMAVSIGILCAFAGNSFIFDLHNTFTKAVFFGGNELSAEVLLFKNWNWGVIGGTIVGFHLLMIGISENAFKKKEKWAYRYLWIALLSWFVIDSGISIYTGAIHNVVIINLVALVMIGIPLIATRKAFVNQQK